MSRIGCGVDFGTESARALLLDLETGDEIGSAVSMYTHGVMDRELWVTGEALPPQWALQDPDDWMDALADSIQGAVREAGVDGSDIVSLGIDTTACTVVPARRDLTPLSRLDDLRKNPWAWARLWKDHASQDCAEDLNRRFADTPDFLEDYGGALSPEWMLPKALLILRCAPEVWDRAELLIEQEDWIVSQLVGHEVRGRHVAGYKGSYRVESGGYPEATVLDDVEAGFSGVLGRLGRDFLDPGDFAGGLTGEWAERLGLRTGLPIAIGNMDAHVALLGVGCTKPGTLVAVMGTSVCDLVMHERHERVAGIQGVVRDGIIPGHWAYEAGQAGVGDAFSWFVDVLRLAQVGGEPVSRSSLFAHLEAEAEKLAPASTGVVALDWLNGNRSVLINADLSGVFAGITLTTSVVDLYRALLEGVAFGQQVILEAFEECGIAIERIIACGGLSKKSPLLMQILADVTGREIEVSASANTPALGAALHGALAAGLIEDWDRAAALVSAPSRIYTPDTEAVAAYERLRQSWRSVHDWFGVEHPELMKEWRTLHRQGRE
ncbi:L-ribulokinase [Schaalia turicensis ACS-279-V-Col4]|uniref:L-ribulokinase n=1 Tax=Schaalia turicensis ACS-279-V-Col4 TaxID=883077 RepID=K0ZIZ1_9ACTO|nr:ribulokinase [Schaalia turicensis]EJZ87735.1 L-ribulokinase [Schaalia turicensis ACS-279-V-Col4]QYB16835.1 ribulokinase [Schaalia turicensis]